MAIETDKTITTSPTQVHSELLDWTSDLPEIPSDHHYEFEVSKPAEKIGEWRHQLLIKAYPWPNESPKKPGRGSY